MNDLASIQAFVTRAVQESAPLAEHAEISKLTPGVVLPNEKLTAVGRLDIYREQFWMRHRDVLEEDYVALHVLMGCETFDRMARDYLTSCPPRSFTLRDLGDRLAEFLATDPRWSHEASYADLARLEWCFVDAFDAPDAPPLDLSVIAAAKEEDWPKATLVIHPSVQRVDLAYASHEYRAKARVFYNDGGERPEPPAKTRVPLVVYRGPERLMYIDLEPAAFALLGALADGANLERACDVAAEAAGAKDASELEPYIGAWFQQWTQLGWVSEVRF